MGHLGVPFPSSMGVHILTVLLVAGNLLFIPSLSAPSISKEWTAMALKHSNQNEMLHAIRSRRQASQSKNRLDVQLFKVETKIAVRFASTIITSRISNKAGDTLPMDFIIQLPLNAYISNFSLEVDGVTFYGKVRDKCEGEDENTFDAFGSLSSGRISAL
jgi:hypothetical protein